MKYLKEIVIQYQTDLDNPIQKKCLQLQCADCNMYKVLTSVGAEHTLAFLPMQSELNLLLNALVTSWVKKCFVHGHLIESWKEFRDALKRKFRSATRKFSHIVWWPRKGKQGQPSWAVFNWMKNCCPYLEYWWVMKGAFQGSSLFNQCVFPEEDV